MVASVSVAPTIQQLLGPERDHHWCIPFSVTGNPKPELQWYHENVALLEQDFMRTRIHLSTESEDHGCLQLVNPTHIHNGVYRLVAKNEYGRDEKKVSAQFIDPPYINHTGVLSRGFVRWGVGTFLSMDLTADRPFCSSFQQKKTSTNVSDDSENSNRAHRRDNNRMCG